MNDIVGKPFAATGPVDPWSFQQPLMLASDQPLPASPELNKGVILYAALNLEEGSEILKGLVRTLERICTDNSISDALAVQLTSINEHLKPIGLQMHAQSRAIRTQLADVPDFRAELMRDEVVEMADGTTDLTVTNCGFALSMGINGAACYEDVAMSNLSKRNPDTGRIDKKPDGKWIKGREFFEPNLTRTIFGA